MARPKYEPGEPTARDKLADAYWRLLAEMPFDEMTARAVVREAGINHNTFYRYFEDIDDMACTLFDEAVIRDFPKLLLSGDVDKAKDAIGAADMQKALLYARSGSSLLQGILKDAIEDAWLSAANVDRDDLNQDEKIDCDIIFGGLVSVLGNADLKPDAILFREIMARPLGQGIIDTLSRIKSLEGRMANGADDSI